MIYNYMKPKFFDDNYIINIQNMEIIPIKEDTKEAKQYIDWLSDGNTPLEFDESIWMGLD